MKAKKIICIIVCFVLTLTLLSGPLRADAEAAGTAIAVGVGCAAIVGLFILAAGYDFETQSDFKTATEAFMNSDGVQYVSKINEFLLGTGNAFLQLRRGNLAPIITADWFPAFWNSILEFFGRGEVLVQTTVSVPSGYALYNGVKLPVVFQYSDSNLQAQCKYHAILYFPSSSTLKNRYVYLCTKGIYKFNNAGTPDASLMKGFVYGRCYLGDSSWSGVYSSSSGGCLGGETSVEVIWSNFNIYNSQTGELISKASTAVTGSTTVSDVIGVYEDENYIPPSDVLPRIEGGTIDGSLEWDLSSSSVYQDLTQAGNIPLTSTQTGVLTDIDAVPQTAVKDEAIEEYRANGLTNVFPFCIPFDIYRFFSILVAEREAPHFDFTLNFGALGAHDISVDLAEWEQVATILRTIELLAFCVGLAFATSKVIKW